jgi:hypothetical protein
VMPVGAAGAGSARADSVDKALTGGKGGCKLPSVVPVGAAGRGSSRADSVDKPFTLGKGGCKLPSVVPVGAAGATSPMVTPCPMGFAPNPMRQPGLGAAP